MNGVAISAWDSAVAAAINSTLIIVRKVLSLYSFCPGKLNQPQHAYPPLTPSKYSLSSNIHTSMFASWFHDQRKKPDRPKPAHSEPVWWQDWPNVSGVAYSVTNVIYRYLHTVKCHTNKMSQIKMLISTGFGRKLFSLFLKLFHDFSESLIINGILNCTCTTISCCFFFPVNRIYTYIMLTPVLYSAASTTTGLRSIEWEMPLWVYWFSFIQTHLFTLLHPHISPTPILSIPWLAQYSMKNGSFIFFFNFRILCLWTWLTDGDPGLNLLGSDC